MLRKGKIYVGIDNGGTGSVGVIDTNDSDAYYSGIPVMFVPDYMKEKRNISRINRPVLLKLLKEKIAEERECFCYVERPLKNPNRFAASISAARAFESVITVLEELEISYDVIDSRLWQKLLLPDGTKGVDLKQESFNVGIQMFPKLAMEIIKQNDADAILIAEYARIMKL